MAESEIPVIQIRFQKFASHIILLFSFTTSGFQLPKQHDQQRVVCSWTSPALSGVEES